MVHVPTVDEEDAKRQHRERERLIAAKTAHVNRIKGLLATQGVGDANPLRADWPELLEGLRTGDGRPIPPRLAAELIREWQRLRLVIEMIGTVESEREHAQADDESVGGGAVGEVVGIGGWRNLRLVQTASTGVGAPGEITP